MFFSRKSPRAQRYDYSSPGGYFITICTKDREHYFGEIGRDDSSNHPIMKLNELGQYAHDEIARVADRKTVDIHERIVMPNHVHILLVIDERSSIVGADHQSALNKKEMNQSTIITDHHQSALNRGNPSDTTKGDLINRPYTGPSLSSVVKLFKGNVSKFAKNNTLTFARQRSFHDHIIRNEQEYERIKYYIQTNPKNRYKDTFYE